MNLYLKGELLSEVMAADVVRVFYRISSSKKSLVIQGKEIEINITSQIDISWIMVNAIKDCKIQELHITQKDEVLSIEGKNELKEETILGISNQVNIKDAGAEVNDTQAKNKKATVSKNKVKEVKTKNDKSKDIKKVEQKHTETEKIIDSFVKQSVSFENFVTNIVTWLELGKRQCIFEEIIKAAIGMTNIKLKNIADILAKKGIIIGDTERLFFGRKIINKFKGNISFMKLVKIIASYKNFEFKNEEETVETNLDVKDEEKVAEVKDSEIKDEQEVAKVKKSEIEDGQKVAKAKESEVEDEEKTTGPKRIKMDCMPEIPDFEELLGSIDKTQPIQTRVNEILTQMGLNKLALAEREVVIEITNTAMRMKKITYTKIKEKSTISGVMYFSEFINNFIKEYEKGKFIKVEVFLEQLQQIIVNEDEIID